MFGIMTTATPMFACFAGSGSKEFQTFIYVILGCWIATLALGCANFVLTCLTGDIGFKTFHFTWFAIYAAAVAAMYFGLLPDAFAILAVPLAFGVPVLVGVHFVTLLRERQRFRISGEERDS